VSTLLAAALGSVAVALVSGACAQWLLAGRPPTVTFEQFADPPRTLH
jgi:hypothetical protein